MAVVGGSLDQMLGSQSLSNLLGQDKMTPALFRPPAAKPTRLEQAQETLTGIEQKLGETQKQIGEFEAQKQARQAEEEAKRAAKGAELARKEREEIEASPVVQESQRIALEAAQARFEPSQRNATENAALFSLIGAIGFAIGAGGKKNAMQAMAAMNGMVEGVRKGDMERYTREKSTFETNLNALYRSYQLLATEAKRAVDLASRNKEQARLDFESVLAQEGADFVKQYYQKFGLVGTQKLLEQQAKGAQRMLQMSQQAEQREQARVQAEQARMEREQERQRGLQQLQEQRLEAQRQNILTRLQGQAELTKMRADLAEERSKAKGEAKGKLMDKDVRQLEAYDSISQGLDELRRTFKPEYASFGVLGFGADISAEAKRRLGEKEGVEAMRWWSRYEQLQAPNRHALFGATLTGNELKNYQSFTAKKSDSPEFVVASLGDQIEYSRGQAELKRNLFREANKEVPSYPTRNYFGTYSGPAQPPAAALATTTAPSRQLSPQDQQALDWANSNPNDPRSTQIKQRLGVQ